MSYPEQKLISRMTPCWWHICGLGATTFVIVIALLINFGSTWPLDGRYREERTLHLRQQENVREERVNASITESSEKHAFERMSNERRVGAIEPSSGQIQVEMKNSC